MASENSFSHLQNALVSRRIYDDPKTSEALPRQLRADQLQPHPDNPKIHGDEQNLATASSLDIFGQVGDVRINHNNGYIIDGHQRAWLALGYSDDTMVDVAYYDITDTEHEALLPILDRLVTLATYKKDTLEKLLTNLSAEVNPASLIADSSPLQKLLSDMAEDEGIVFGDVPDEDDEMYSRKIEAPIYTPSDEKPLLNDLYDDTKTKTLIADIQASTELTQQEKEFLTIAAQRHSVLNFSNIADYYAHSSEAVQQLMEDSALIIIDYDRAIELGFVKLTNEIADLELQEYG